MRQIGHLQSLDERTALVTFSSWSVLLPESSAAAFPFKLLLGAEAMHGTKHGVAMH